MAMLLQDHIGSDFDEFLKQQGLLAECEMAALKRVLKWQRGLEWGHDIEHSNAVAPLNTYCKQALKLAEVTYLRDDEGYAARIPGFRGLIVSGRTKKDALDELETALVDWINLALRRGLGLPHLRPPKQPVVTAR